MIDDACPLLGIISNKFPELGGRGREYAAPELGHARLHGGICQRGVDLAIEPLDDLRRRPLGCTETKPSGDRVARHSLGNRADLGQYL